MYRADDTSLAVPRAVKVLRVGHEAIRERFLAEARVLARLRHPNLLRVVDYGEQDGTPWMAMELARAGTVADRLKAGPMAFGPACEVLFEILCGLVVIHDSGFVHRDLKPSNVLFGADGEAWISDLGVISGSDSLVERHWRTSGPVGTVGYASPELRRGESVDARADIYACGAVFWAMLTARPPIDFSVVGLKPELLDVVPPGARAIIRRATAHDPASRYPSCEAMAADVAALHAEHSRGASPPDVAMMVFSRFRRRARSEGGGEAPSSVPRSLSTATSDVLRSTSLPVSPETSHMFWFALLGVVLLGAVLTFLLLWVVPV